MSMVPTHSNVGWTAIHRHCFYSLSRENFIAIYSFRRLVDARSAARACRHFEGKIDEDFIAFVELQYLLTLGQRREPAVISKRKFRETKASFACYDVSLVGTHGRRNCWSFCVRENFRIRSCG